ncbi:uncharacterized protein LOC115763528 isoform X2 [Drosophila novamexicana]|nr:uncharacterized protein LOC115763528 isoform X2 [Drosophila novamexicana]
MEAYCTSLLILNDDCLDNIFQYLALEELIPLFGKVHPVIDAAIDRQLHRFRHFEFSMRFPPQYDAIQLLALGRHLQSININVGYSVRSDSVLALLHPLCAGAEEAGRLKALKIQHANITSDYIKVISLVAPFLLELDLSRCDVQEPSQLTLFLRSATKLRTLALSNRDAAGLEKSLLGRMQLLKVNWLVGTELFDVASVNQRYPLLSIIVYQSNHVDVYGPPVARNIGYFH